jgi:hypothetical protein
VALSSNHLTETGESIMAAKTRLLVLVALAVGASYLYAAEEKQKVTLEGTLVSASCYLADNSATGNEMNGIKECGTGCLKQGKPAGLVTKEKHFHILDAPSLLLASYVGQVVRVTGIDYNGVISVKKAEVSKDGEWKEIDIKSLIPGRRAKSS